MSDYHAAKSYLYSRLDAALTVEVYEQSAPFGTVHPFVTYSIEPETHSRYKGGTARTSFESVVRVVGKGATGPLETHLDAIQSALEMKRGTARGLRLESERIGMMTPLTHFPEGSNEPTRELGYRFRLRVME